MRLRACEDSADCDGACGVTASDPQSQSYLTCEAEGSALLGEYCGVDEECADGFCTDGQCSECATDADCSAGNTCTGDDALTPHQCLGTLRDSGASCFDNSDCQSDYCIPAQSVEVCDSDGRSCRDDTDCSWHELGAECVDRGSIGTCY